MTTTSPHRLVADLEARFRELEAAFAIAYWDSQVDATEENERRRAATELELRRLLGDRSVYDSVRQALDEELHDAVLRRQLEVLWQAMTENQMDEMLRSQIVELSTAVQGDFAKFRPEVDGERLSENDVDEVLQSSDDQEHRRLVWEASKEVGAVVAERVRELARLRNRAAHDQGFADYYRMSLELQELPEEWLFRLLDEVASFTDESFKRFKESLDDKLRERFRTGTIYPWHYADPFFQQLPPDAKPVIDAFFRDKKPEDLAERTFSAWGIDLSSVIGASDLYARENKNQHAFCIDIDRRGDVRILANLEPNERWTATMLHECGHAAYDLCIDDRLPFLLHTPSHIFTTEAMAILSGRLVRDVRWLTDIARIESREVQGVSEELRRADASESLLFARWVLVMVNFERDLYSDPESDLDARWWELVEQFQGVTPPPGRSAPDWAAKIHIAGSPVYYHNYLLGELLATQLTKVIEAECGGLVGVPAAGDMLRDRLFRPGNLMRWDALIEEATGRPLAADDFAEEIALATRP